MVENVGEVKGIEGIENFVDAIGIRFDPDWARGTTRVTAAKHYVPDDNSLLKLADDYCRYRQAIRRTATTHYWKPEACRDLYQAITGEVIGRKLNKTKLKTIKEAYNSSRFNSLRTSIDNNGWLVKVKDKTTEADSPDGVAAATIDPDLLMDLEMRNGIYTTIGMSRHPLSQCTLFGNCGAMHVVHDRNLLVPGTFKATTDDYLESGTSSISIVGRGKRVMKNTFHGRKGDHTVDLTLSDVAVVEGFHVNIVSWV
ncbi:hypothetical protein E4U58_007284 [Claviceps cyperi]|nr:hypothetical protein E4U58_007284 [Claviceps cyperi]